MNYEFYCPSCSAVLNLNNNIVLSVQRSNGESGIIFLDTALGNYTKVLHSSLEIEAEEIVKIFCPVCHKDLLCLPDKNLARLVIKDEEGENMTILFSVKYGEESTYLLNEENVEKTYGKHKKDIDFESLSLCK